jgi:hypothetical protein
MTADPDNIQVSVTKMLKVIMLLNERPRFGPKDRRLRFDSYSLCSELEDVLKAHGVDVYPAMVALPRE